MAGRGFVATGGGGGTGVATPGGPALHAGRVSSERLTGDRFGEVDEVDRTHCSTPTEGWPVVAQGTTRGSGSTATGAVLVRHEGKPHWLVFNVGDSRVYCHVGSELAQLTVDHSLVQELIDAGELAAEDAAGFGDRGVITRAIGARDSFADSWLLPVVRMVSACSLCSDGLHSEVDDETIRAVLTMTGRPEAAADVLIDRANRARRP